MLLHAVAVSLSSSPIPFPPETQGGAVSIGNFDGVHAGHQAIIAQLLRQAEQIGGPAVMLTFDQHPVRILRPEHAPPQLLWPERKQQLLRELGVGEVVFLPTDRDLLTLTPREFFRRVLVEGLRVRGLVEGTSFRFGRNREGNTDVLQELTREFGVRFEVVPSHVSVDAVVSSSRIRNLLAEGALAEANTLLTRPHRIRGKVVPGAGRGRELGFPTANLASVPVLVPGDGVYAGLAHRGDQRGPAAVHVGRNLTFGESQTKIEVHLLDTHEDLLGTWLEIDFIEKLREVRAFSSVEELRAQIERDVNMVRSIIHRWHGKTNR